MMELIVAAFIIALMFSAYLEGRFEHRDVAADQAPCEGPIFAAIAVTPDGTVAALSAQGPTGGVSTSGPLSAGITVVGAVPDGAA